MTTNVRQVLNLLLQNHIAAAASTAELPSVRAALSLLASLLLGRLPSLEVSQINGNFHKVYDEIEKRIREWTPTSVDWGVAYSDSITGGCFAYDSESYAFHFCQGGTMLWGSRSVFPVLMGVMSFEFANRLPAHARLPSLCLAATA